MAESLSQQWHYSTNFLANDIHSQLQSDTTSSQLDDATSDAVSSLSNKWFEKVKELYGEPHRAYHNMGHVQDVLASLDLVLGTHHHLTPPEQPKDTAISTLAAFFHDVIYNPKSSTNEKDSANLFLDFVSELVDVIRTFSGHEQNANIDIDMNENETHQPSRIKSHMSESDMILQIEQCIIATATHIASATQARETNNTILATFLDADMSILGRDPDKYEKYARSIRKEYEFVDHSVYCEKRAKILYSFLPATIAVETVDETVDATLIDGGEKSSSENTQGAEGKQHISIYATEKGRELWETQAQENLRHEIGMLFQGLIPGEIDCLKFIAST